ncbi:BEL1-like homeodomain protein 7 [Rutidosis leptorrhynchoides]|uniref:BEL1-like homeodomain protein 7 n=1 Tax=Rutidosis leptorrhynchoides TaxID=125765 RepID=UPI003A99AC5B
MKKPLQNLSSSESLIPAGNITMYTLQQPIVSNDIQNIGIHDSGVVSQQDLLKDCRSYEMLLMDQMGSNIPPLGSQFQTDQYLNTDVNFVGKSTQDSECYSYEFGNVISNSKYLKAAQQLLDEVVNVKKIRKQEYSKNESVNDSHEVFGESKQDSSVLSAAEKQDLQNKKTKLSSMLTEVDKRYNQYYNQMDIIVSSFDVIVGCGASKAYTSLALKTISTHFRCLRDAINSQIKVISRSLGEKDSNANKIVISRLKFVDQKLRQQKRAQQFGHERIWRPQRGLPESCVSVLRAWLFEHFLHPYPKDSEKTMLARQTGLTKSQVSNWFINARVRLWKPMVEEMYQEEYVDAEMDSNSSSEITPKKTILLNRAQDIKNQSATTISDLAHHTKMSSSIVEDHDDALKTHIINEGVSLTLRLQHVETNSLHNLQWKTRK